MLCGCRRVKLTRAYCCAWHAQVVAALQKRGVAVWMVTGDNRLAARAIAQQLGIQPQFVMSEVRVKEN